MQSYFIRSVNTDILDNSSLSFTAKGIGLYVCGFPKGHLFYIQDLIEMSSDSEDLIKSALNELESFGYISELPCKGKYETCVGGKSHDNHPRR